MNSLKIMRNLSVQKGQAVVRISDDQLKHTELNSGKIIKSSIVTRGEALAEDMRSFRDEDTSFKSQNTKRSY